MAVTINDVTTNFAHVDRASLVEDWTWLIGANKLPVVVTAMGTVFLHDSSDGSVHLLDPASAAVEPIADNLEEFQAMLQDSDFVMQRFLVDDFVQARESLGLLALHQVYGFKVPPILGGTYEVENLEATEVAVHLSISGQIHHQFKDLPPGSPISSVSLK